MGIDPSIMPSDMVRIMQTPDMEKQGLANKRARVERVGAKHVDLWVFSQDGTGTRVTLPISCLSKA